MTQRTGNPLIRITLVSILHSVLIFSSTPVRADLIAYTSFEEPGVYPGKLYTDTGDKLVDHSLINNTNQPLVSWAQTSPNSELGFSSYYRNTHNNVGLSDGDYVGVTSSKTGFSAFPSGFQGFQMSDTDGRMTTTLNSVDLDGFSEPMVSLDLYVAKTTWETSDRIRVWATVDGSTEINLLNTQGQDIDTLAMEGLWTTLSASLTGYTMATLAFELDSNAGPESIYIDNIEFNGEVSPVPVPHPVPVPSAFLLASLGMGVASLWSKRKEI
jgi:hypothetical protein